MVSPPRFYVFTLNSATGQSFYILDRLNNHREVASYRGHPNRDTAQTWAVAHARCDQLNWGRP